MSFSVGPPQADASLRGAAGYVGLQLPRCLDIVAVQPMSVPLLQDLHDSDRDGWATDFADILTSRDAKMLENSAAMRRYYDHVSRGS